VDDGRFRGEGGVKGMGADTGAAQGGEHAADAEAGADVAGE